MIGQLIMGGSRPLSWHQGAWQRLIASILRYANELRAHEPYFEGLTAEAKTDAVALAAELIEDQSSKFELESVPDQFAAAMREYLRAKVEQRAPEVMIAKEGKPTPKVINIMDALKESMAKQGRAKVREAVRKRMGKAAPKRQRVPQSAAQSKSGSRRTAH